MRRWWTGRTFYACPCGERVETLAPAPPAVIKCDRCKEHTMAQWIPPAVAREMKEDGL
jgi:hypothetical protein